LFKKKKSIRESEIEIEIENFTFPAMDWISGSSSRRLDTEEPSEMVSDGAEFSVSRWSRNRNLDNVEEDSMENGFPSNEHDLSYQSGNEANLEVGGEVLFGRLCRLLVPPLANSFGFFVAQMATKRLLVVFFVLLAPVPLAEHTAPFGWEMAQTVWRRRIQVNFSEKYKKPQKLSVDFRIASKFLSVVTCLIKLSNNAKKMLFLSKYSYNIPIFLKTKLFKKN
jgi:hypothetical protein